MTVSARATRRLGVVHTGGLPGALARLVPYGGHGESGGVLSGY
ncbi:hypothetical protein [Streptomyces barkulensis]|nr:hypothetical protein [Streptomyces barkulensis]